MNNKYLPIEPRFFNKVSITDSCWVWIGSKFTTGYGRMSVNGKEVRAHRVSWELHRGPIPEGMSVLHKCDNPPCVNPEHLFLGTQKDNAEDCRVKRRTTCGEKDPRHKLTSKDVEGIRELRNSSNMSYRKLSKMFGVDRSTIIKIVSGKTWKESCANA